MHKLQPVRGTHDLMEDDMRRHQRVRDTARAIFERYNFEQIATPIFEFTHVFARTLGEDSDVVSKEMYTFEDRGGERLTLRPEGTAGVVRAVISNGKTQSMPLKLWYNGPMFRYERPQKGRQRQFHQIGCELFGPTTPQADAEAIKMGKDILDTLGVPQYVVQVNTLGDGESRTAYRTALVEYFSDHKKDLSEDSIRRLKTNPLRILDSKDGGDKKLVQNAPHYRDFLNQSSVNFYEGLKEHLKWLKVDFKENDRLVRGLDYYTHTVFEFVSDDLGAQSTLLAGGRYDGLMKTMGGPDVPGVGWGAGIERLAMVMKEPPGLTRLISVIPVGDEAQKVAVTLSDELRQHGFAAEMTYAGNLKKRLNRANKINAVAAILIGEDELQHQTVTVRLLESGQQETMKQKDVHAFLEKKKLHV